MDFAIITDSSCSLPEDFIHDNNISILTLSFMCNGIQYRCFGHGRYFDKEKFHELLMGPDPITTSLPNLADSNAILRNALQQEKDILYIGFSSALSGAFQSTELLMKALQVEYPNRKMYAVDTLGASLGQGLLVYYAVKLANQGKTIDEVYSWLQNNKLHMAHWFTVDDLMFLHRGGRISKTTATAGTLLNIKPILHVDNNGQLVLVEAARGRKKALGNILNHIRSTISEPVTTQSIFIVQYGCEKDAQRMAEQIKEAFPVKDVMIGDLDPVIASHCGPGTIGIFFLATKR